MSVYKTDPWLDLWVITVANLLLFVSSFFLALSSGDNIAWAISVWGIIGSGFGIATIRELRRKPKRYP